MIPLWLACDAPPPIDEGVDFRDGLSEGEGMSGERGNIKISEVLWSGAVKGDVWVADDVFVELRNEGVRPIDLSQWRLTLTGPIEETWVLPDLGRLINVGEHVAYAAKNTGCLPLATVVSGLRLPMDAGFALTLRDRDERLLETIGDVDQLPFAGGYDGALSRSMERSELMFGSDGGNPAAWHFMTGAEVDVPNDDLVHVDCRATTRATPGRPNSPDYAGAFAAGSLE